ncbi:hypothetical protein VNO77_43545 [Canavalia gladiata]|uniref:Uncharacterized protein n=1 Tax=Canavalia gladiata TaxID=3824 RepID=A0AAN9JWM1_CANGL
MCVPLYFWVVTITFQMSKVNSTKKINYHGDPNNHKAEFSFAQTHHHLSCSQTLIPAITHYLTPRPIRAQLSPIERRNGRKPFLSSEVTCRFLPSQQRVFTIAAKQRPSTTSRTF